jgi:putative transposase
VIVVYSMMTLVLGCLIDLITVRLMKSSHKDLEIAILRHQLRIVERRQERGPHIPRWQKVALAVLVNRLKGWGRGSKEQLNASVLLFRPATVLGWHRALVRRKWRYKQGANLGRPRIDAELEAWIVRIAKANVDLGYEKIQGELEKLGFEVSPNTVKHVMKRHGIPPTPERKRYGMSWRTFISHYKDQMLACDLFTLETLGLKMLYVLFFLELGTRRVHIAGFTTNPTGEWVTQQARQLEKRKPAIRFLIRDNDRKYPKAFDETFRSVRIKTIKTPYRAPNANAYAERWVRTIREECLDKLLIVNDRHLRRVLGEYETYYNQRRPHQGLAQNTPDGLETVAGEGPIRCHKVLGGIIHDYYRDAA